jgi:hypothetical protein
MGGRRDEDDGYFSISRFVILAESSGSDSAYFGPLWLLVLAHSPRVSRCAR